MSVLEELQSLFDLLGVQVETGVFSSKAPTEYIVLIPLIDSFEVHADNQPLYDVQEVRISIFTKGNYIKLKNKIIRELLGCDFTITSRQYIGYENQSDYHHYNVDVAKHYEF